MLTGAMRYLMERLQEVDYLNVEDPDVFSHRAWELEYQRKQELRRNQPVRAKKKSNDMEL